MISKSHIRTDHQEATRAVLEHVQRYRLTILSAIRELPDLELLNNEQLRSLVRFMCHTGMLGRDLLYQHRPYFYCKYGPDSIDDHRTARLPRTNAGPLSRSARIRNYAILAFCCLGGFCRQRLTKSEIQSEFSSLDRPGLPLNYYVHSTESVTRLGFIRVDTCSSGRWDSVGRRCRQDLESHLSRRPFRHLIEANAFELTLITALPSKVERLRQYLTIEMGPSAHLVRVVAFPELMNLVAPPPAKT